MSLTSQDPTIVDQSAEGIATTEETAPIMRDLSYTQIIFWATVIGIAGGLVATTYYYLLENSLHLVWHQVPELIQAQPDSEFLAKNHVWIATSMGGLLVGLSL